MTQLFKILLLSCAVVGTQVSIAETIYTWTDEQQALTNYGGIPPDDELATDAVKIVDLQKGLATRVDFPIRAVDAAVEKARQLKELAPTTVHTSESLPALPKMTASSSPAPAQPAPGQQASTPQQPRLLGSGSSKVEDSKEIQRLSEQEVKLEEQAKSARRLAIEKRKEEMKILAERVRNGAASRQEIAALMTYRQTASFGEARSALARPKVAPIVQLND